MFHNHESLLSSYKCIVPCLVPFCDSQYVCVPSSPRFPDCEDPYPRSVDLLPSSSATAEPPAQVQRDYGFWCPRELKVDPGLGYTFLGARDCSAPCPSMHFRRDELLFARYFVGVVSIVCLSATLFTFLTFLIDMARFRYPERPIVFYAVCYMMVALVYFLGFLLEDRVACNPASPGRFRAATITQGSHNKACTLLFMTLYFFTMAGGAWWVVLTLTWFLAAVPKWGSEAIEKKALIFHAAAWGLPGILTVTLLALNKVCISIVFVWKCIVMYLLYLSKLVIHFSTFFPHKGY